MGSVVMALAFGLQAPSTLAQTTQDATQAPIDVWLSIKGPTECVSAQEIGVAVRRRSARVQFLKTGEHAVDLDIMPARTDSGAIVWRANVELLRSGAREPTRTLETPDCASLADAVGFIVALTFDPPSVVRPEQEPESKVDAPTPQPTMPPAEPQAASREVPMVDSDTDVVATSASQAAVSVHVSTAFEVVSEAGPLLLPGFGLGVQVGSMPEPGFGPAFSGHLQVSGFPGRTATEGGGHARFRLLAGRLTLCPLAFRAQVFTLRPCAFGTFGALDAAGSATREPESHLRPWGSVGGGLLAGVNASEVVRIDVDAGLGATLIRDAFQFAPDVFYKTPATSVRAGIGLSLLIP